MNILMDFFLGMDEEKVVLFVEYVFFDDMLEDFFKSGFIRNYME